MDCPICKEPMVVLELDNIEIDNCAACGGIWLDSGELELLLEGAGEKDTVLNSFELSKDSKEKKINCPICLKKMDKIIFANKIIIDECCNKHGLWFDQGELYQMIESGGPDRNNKILLMLKTMFSEKLKIGNR